MPLESDQEKIRRSGDIEREKHIRKREMQQPTKIKCGTVTSNSLKDPPKELKTEKPGWVAIQQA